jgi:hypothetical protein
MKHKNSHQLLSILAVIGLLAAATTTGFAAGASNPFQSYEAESGSLGGGATVRSLNGLPTAPTPELEASGGKFVQLNATGESVTWTTTATANTIVVRASIPDSSGGGGTTATLALYVNGVFRQTLNFSSQYSWVYGVNGFTDNNPATGTPKRFYDDCISFINGAAVTAGSTIMLKKDSGNTAAFYYVDMIRLENVGSAVSQPANTLSITSYGAVSNDGNDDTSAIQACVNACQSQGKGMWIPAGTFEVDSARINTTDVDIYGAGMWYTTISTFGSTQHAFNMKNGSIQDIFINSHATGRSGAQGTDSGVLIRGAGGWTVQRVWVHRGGTGYWCTGTDGTVQDCRSTESWADGINLNNGPDVETDKAGINLTAQNNYIIGSGDDGIAINAQNGGGTSGNMVNTKVLNNTSIGSYWANGIRVAGGRGSLVQGNWVTDSGDNNGIRVGKFGGLGNPTESVLVNNNLINRGAGIRGAVAGMMVTDGSVATITSNTVADARQAGILVINCTATFTGNTVTHPTFQGFEIPSGSTGSGTFNNNTVSSLNSGEAAFENDAPGTFSTTQNGNSWQGVSGVTFYQNTQYAGTAGQPLSVGTYTLSQLAAKGVPNDWASSARVPSGRTVIMYHDDNFGGTSWTITSDTPDFSTLSPSANDQMSSCKVQ